MKGEGERLTPFTFPPFTLFPFHRFHRHHGPQHVADLHPHGCPHRVVSEAADAELVSAGQKLGKAEHVLQSRLRDCAYVSYRGALRLQPDLAATPALAGGSDYRAQHHAVAVAVVDREGDSVRPGGLERVARVLELHRGARGRRAAGDKRRAQEEPSHRQSSSETGLSRPSLKRRGLSGPTSNVVAAPSLMISARSCPRAGACMTP